MSIRCFIAIELTNAIRRAVAKRAQSLQRPLQTEPSIRWVDPARMHLTLKFLGEIDDTALTEVCQLTQAVAASTPPFDVEFGNFGSFPPNKPARVLWLGVVQMPPELKELHARLDAALAEIGFNPENRSFSPHLTLARLRQLRAGKLAQQAVAESAPFTLGTQPVNSITVFQSDLTRSGPVYTPLQHAPLAGK